MPEVYTLSTLDYELPVSPEDRYGVLGYPVKHSLSPQFQLAGFAKREIAAQYVRIEVPIEQLSAAVEKLKQMNFKGWNCTLPHKIEMLKLCRRLDESAQKLQAVNTVLNEDGTLIGFNTDGTGWVRAIREEFSVDVRDLRVMILGAGGAGQALATQAALEKCERLVLVNRTLEKAQALAKALDSHFHSEKLQGSHNRLLVLPWDEDAIAAEVNNIDLIVNATSVGLKPHDPAVLPERVLQPHLLVYDTVYRQTKFLEAAQDAGARCANGLSMLLHQGALAFEIWTGKKAPIEEMRKALKEAAGI